MTKNEIAQLLALIQAFDHRTVGKMDVAAWHAAAAAGKWTSARAKQAAVELLGSGAPGQWLTPAHVAAKLAEVRRDISRRLFTTDITPPSELDGDVARELHWRRTIIPALIDAHLDEWAATGKLPAPTNELPKSSPAGQTRLRALIGGAFDIRRALQ